MNAQNEIPIEAKKMVSKKFLEILFNRYIKKGHSKDESMQLAFSKLSEIFSKSK